MEFRQVVIAETLEVIQKLMEKLLHFRFAFILWDLQKILRFYFMFFLPCSFFFFLKKNPAQVKILIIKKLIIYYFIIYIFNGHIKFLHSQKIYDSLLQQQLIFISKTNRFIVISYMIVNQ